MKKWFKRKIKLFLLKKYAECHNYCYRKISKLAKQLEGDVHPKHRIMDYHKFFVDNINSSDEILDIGHGNGLLTCDVAKKAKTVLGIDIKYKKAKTKSKRNNLKLIQGNATTYNFNKKFDKIILSNVLEHIEDRIFFLKKLRDISDTILLRVPMLNRDWITVYKKENDLEYKLDKTHFIEYTLDSLKDELAQSGWELISHQINWGELLGVLKSKK